MSWSDYHRVSLLFRHRSGIYVRHLVSGSVAEENGRIEVGDRILEANGVDVRHATIDETAILMAVSDACDCIILLYAHIII